MRGAYNRRTPKETKYGNEITVAPCAYGYSHQSKLEGSVCQLIYRREKAGELKHLQHQDHIKLSGWYTYIPDFKCQDTATGEEFWIEAKGFADHRWASTKKGWRHAGPGKLEIWLGDYRNPKLDEVIIPKGAA